MIKIYQIESTNHCNMRCGFCPTRYQWADRQKGFLELDLLKRIDFSNTEYVELQLSGEPSLHPHLDDIINFFYDKGIKVGMATNGIVKINNSKLFNKTITVASERVIVESGENVQLQKLGDDYPYEDYSHREVRDSTAVRCDTPFNYVSVQWDGDVVPCCKCHGKQHTFGNLYDMTFEQIINSKKRSDFLNMMDSGVEKNYICQFCEFPNPHKIHEKILEQKGE